MKQLIFKLFFTLLGGIFILYFVMPWSYFGLDVPFSGKAYRLGLDLQGGIELDYQIDLSEAELEPDYDAARKKSIIE
jgi:preprotein translocase subunit SecD